MLEYGSVCEYLKIAVILPVARPHDMQNVPSYTKHKKITIK